MNDYLIFFGLGVFVGALMTLQGAMLWAREGYKK